ncbi:MAG: hypothetical protein H7Z43_16055, partial [Clostridia bacterium]|nr:hypothetical protein [Deltaproteobacteria bacterium]
MLPFVVKLVILSAIAESTVVVGIRAGAGVEERLEIIRRTQPFGATLTGSEMHARLAGLTEGASELAAAELEARLEHADDLESINEIDAAQRERHSVIDAYERTPVVSSTMQALAARAMQDRAAALFLANRKRDAAVEFANVHRRFPTVPIDLMRYRPDIVQAYERAAGDPRNVARTKLTIRSTRPGVVMLDARAIGEMTNMVTVDVVRGNYMLWLRDASGYSLARPLDIGPTPIEVDIDFELELRLEGKSPPQLRCTDDCEDFVSRLRSAAKLDRVIAIRMTGTD